MDIDYAGTISMYKNLNGNKITKLQHNFEDEDFITFSILAKNDTMYYVEASFEIDGVIGRGWIEKSDHIKIYCRNYDQSLNLYTQPSEQSPVQCIIEEYFSEQCDVIDYDGDWLKIKISLNGEKFEGWLSPDMQCCNPYSTCG